MERPYQGPGYPCTLTRRRPIVAACAPPRGVGNFVAAELQAPIGVVHAPELHLEQYLTVFLLAWVRQAILAGLLSDRADSISQAGCTIEKISDEGELCRRTAAAIADGKVVG
jgi:hypothetical protein